MIKNNLIILNFTIDNQTHNSVELTNIARIKNAFKDKPLKTSCFTFQINPKEGISPYAATEIFPQKAEDESCKETFDKEE